MDLELNSEGGSGGHTSVCSDQLFDACWAELGRSIGVLDGLADPESRKRLPGFSQ